MVLDLLICDVCNNEFDGKNYIPYIINTCGHTFCSTCLKVNGNQNKNNTGNCPYCTISYNSNSLKKNYFAIKIINSYRNKEILDRNYVIQNYLNIVPTFCREHYDNINGYDIANNLFVCLSCDKKDADVINMKQIIDLNMEMLISKDTELKSLNNMIVCVKASSDSISQIKKHFTNFNPLNDLSVNIEKYMKTHKINI